MTFRFQPRDKDVLMYIVEKGYVTVDGASLTVVAVSDDWFEVMLVAYTQEKIVTAAKPVGGEVNIEVDMTGKYIEVSLLSLIVRNGAYFAVETSEGVPRRSRGFYAGITSGEDRRKEVGTEISNYIVHGRISIEYITTLNPNIKPAM